MNDQDVKRVIVDVLHAFATDGLAQNAIKLLNSMGYDSEKRPGKLSNTPSAFVTDFDPAGRFNAGKGLLGQWQSVDLLFQLTENEIKSSSQGILDFGAEKRVDRTIIQSYLFFAIALQNDGYTRTQLANITREINKLFPMPAMILFRHGDTLTLSIINRRLHKRDELKDVLEKVTLIKDINFINPHRAHIEILFDLSLDEAHRRYGFTNFVELHQAWQKALDSSELNKRFFGEIANWYFWATQHVVFPEDGGEDTEVRNATSVIRLITRLIFIWFVREKGLVPDDLFDQRKLKEILNYSDPGGSTYYKAILQNLFFATLNREMNTPQKPDNRKFRSRSKQSGGRDPHYNITNLYRYEDYFRSPAEALALFSQIPFLNGGLFECLDKPDKDDPTKILRIDGFSDRAGNKVCVPDFLFFCEEQGVDLNEAYGTANRRYKVRGLIDIFNRYKFTIDENTPIEEEVALDPELLGKVFENLLANYNPETKATARKQTGSYYTPREIVNYMVDESLIAYLETQLKERIPALQDMESLTELLREVFAYTEKAHPFNAEEVTALIEAIDDIKILDPACGSGAFPMGILHKLVFILSKLDPHNERWKDRQLTRADDMTDSTIRDRAIADIEAAFERNELDYGRKLYLIENCIYGVDIQPIAVQIARLRFFISLVVDQRIDDSQENRGIIPLPNLETKFVAANTLIGLDRPQQAVFHDPAIDEKEEQLARVRKRHFTARTPGTKRKYRDLDEELRMQISELLKQEEWVTLETAEKLAYWDPYDQNASADFFDPEWMFGVQDGFDVTIGNPPYVRADSGDQHLELRNTILASKQYETLWEKWDLYIPFIERGYKLLKPGGVTTMIVSDAFCHSKYAEKSQKWFLQNSGIIRLDFLSKIKVFDAAVRNITYLFQRVDGQHNCPERRVHDGEFGEVILLPSDKQCNLNHRVFFPEEGGLPQFSGSVIPLSQICYISVGMVVHADEKKAPGAFELRDLVSDAKDSLHLKPFVEGKHLARWVPSTCKWLEWGTHRAPSLFRRPTFVDLYEVPEKLISVDMSAGVAELRVTYDNQQLYHNHSAWSFVPWHNLSGVKNNSLKKSARYQGEKPPRPDLPRREELEETSHRFSTKFLLGVMNSSAARDYLRANRRSNIHLYPDDWKKLPVPDATAEQQAPVVELVDQILAARQNDPNANISAMEARIDRLVNDLYGLREEGIRIVEESTGKRE